MNFKPRKVLFPSVISLSLIFSITIAHGSGGRIEGKVSDQKGRVVVGATVSATETTTKQTFNGTTDAQGRYKLEGLPSGTYDVLIVAKGFKDFTQPSVHVDENSNLWVDATIEVASIEATVDVPAGPKANADPLYQALRQQAKTEQDFAGPYASVNNLVLQREGGKFTLHSGEIYFLPPIEGRYTAAVFIGDGELTIVPPTEIEQNSLKLFVDQPTLTEQFSSLVLRFTDKTFDDVKGSANATMANGGAQASRARELFRENQDLVRKRLRDNRELRTLADLYAPKRTGFFNAFINGKRFNKLIFVFDPQGIPDVAPEEVMLLSYGDSDGGIWTAFHRFREYQTKSVSNSEDHRLIDMTVHDIDATIKGTRITATDRITFTARLPGTRVIALNLYPSLRVSRVHDEQNKDLDFIQEAKDQDADFGVILPQPTEAGKTYSITVQYDGTDALRDSGGGNFILIPRSTWYPNNVGTPFGDRAIFNMTFHYPKTLTFVGTGAPASPDTRDGDQAVSRWTSGTTELQVAGFNYGKFKKKELMDKDTGYNIEFYANEEVPDELKQLQQTIEQAERAGVQTFMTLGVISTTKMGDAAIADAENSTRIYNAFFGKLPYTRIAMTQQPAFNFGQAWPTLVFMPYTAFIDTTQRTQLLGMRGGTNTFWRYVAPHEIAHQWWGHIIGWSSYHDQWMSEGFAEFSASLYVQYSRDLNKFVDFWENQRHMIIDGGPATKDRKPYTVGPVTQGYRLNTGKTGGVARFLIYPKGAYILHMLRMMMFKQTTRDTAFQAMMRDFVQTYFNKDVSTEDFKRIVEKHITPEMNVTQDGKMDWFFNEWVYGTEIPSYKLEYKIGSDGTLSGRITQSGVSNNFAMVVPLYADFGKGWAKLGSATLVGNSSVDLGNLRLPSVPKKAAICALNDVLAISIENK